MKIFTIIKTGLGIGAVSLLLAAAPAPQASTGGTVRTVPCRTHALIAAINAANSERRRGDQPRPRGAPTT